MSFVNSEPEFAGERLSQWEQPEDEREFPDITGKSVSGRRIGVELAEWLNEEDIATAIGKERSEASILEAIGEQGPNATGHIDHVWLTVKAGARVTRADAAAFRTEVFSLIDACDRRWLSERYWERGAVLGSSDLDAYPTLTQYLDGAKLWSREHHHWPEGVPWILFRARVDVFNQDTMLTRRVSRSERKTAMIAEKSMSWSPQHQPFQRDRTFQRAHPSQ